jgi:hypothetical protein
MPAAISPTTVGVSTPYTITGSRAVIADLSLDLTSVTPPEFTVDYPTGTAGVQIVLANRPPNPLVVNEDLTAMPSGGSVTHGNRTIEVDKASGGGTETLTCRIIAVSGATTNDAWTVRIQATAPPAAPGWHFQQADNDAAPPGPTIPRLMCDPTSGFTPSGNVREKQGVTFTGVAPEGPATRVGGPPPAVSARWSFTGPLAIPAFPSCGPVAGLPSFAATMPGVYGDTQITVTEEVWFDSACPTPGFLRSSATNSFTIQPRPQRLMLVLDRSGSMALESRWDNAVKGARLLVHLIAALRPGVNVGDQVGILEFDDPVCNWHATVDPAHVGDKVPLGPLAAADALVSGKPSLDFGAPGACTPIGDALVKSMDELGALGFLDDPHFTIILLTDGIENSGTSKVDPATSSPGTVTLFNDYRTAHPNVNNRLSLFAIGLGTYVQDHVLNALPLPPGLPATTNPPIYRNVTKVPELVDAIGQMVSFSLEARQALTLGWHPSPDNSPIKPGPPDDAADDPDPDAGAHPGAVYFKLESNVRMVAVAVLWPDNPTDTPADELVLARRDLSAPPGSSFTTVATLLKKSPTHGFVSVDLGVAAPATMWRIAHLRGGVAQTIGRDDILVFKDLFAKADIFFDRTAYGTGESMVISARVRAGDQPVSGAKIGVELAEPGESLGSFLVQGSKGYEPPRQRGGDPLSPKALMLDTILRNRQLGGLPLLEPTGIFVDGTSELHEVADHPDGPGNYENTFGPLTKEGTYTFRFHVEGTLPDGSPYDEVMTISKWSGVKVDPFGSTFVLNLGVTAPAGMQALQAVVTPRDRGGQYLGPFWPNVIEFHSDVGSFQGEVESRFDGSYAQTLVYPKGTTPVVGVSVQGTPFPPVVGAKGCLGLLLRPLLWLIRLLIRLATGK